MFVIRALMEEMWRERRIKSRTTALTLTAVTLSGAILPLFLFLSLLFLWIFSFSAVKSKRPLVPSCLRGSFGSRAHKGGIELQTRLFPLPCATSAAATAAAAACAPVRALPRTFKRNPAAETQLVGASCVRAQATRARPRFFGVSVFTISKSVKDFVCKEVPT